MKLTTAFVLVLIAVISGGCIPVSTSGSGVYSSPSGNPAIPIPDGNQLKYTILLQSFTVPQHAQIAKIYKQRIESGLGWKDLFIVTKSSSSELYWGVFDSVADAEPTLRKARSHVTKNSDPKKRIKPFAMASVTNIPGSDRSLAKWDLVNNTGTYTLLVASFEDQPKANPAYIGRMGFAEEYCRLLRDQGHQAWYYHGAVISNVTVGSFGPNAVKTVKRRIKQKIGGYITVDKKVIVSDELLGLQETFSTLIYNGREFYEVKRDINGNVVSKSETPAKTRAVVIPQK